MYMFRLVGLLPKLVTRVSPAAIAGAPDTSTTATTAASAAPTAMRERTKCFMNCPPTRGVATSGRTAGTGLRYTDPRCSGLSVGTEPRATYRSADGCDSVEGVVDPVVWRRVLPPHHRIGSAQAEPLVGLATAVPQ